MRPAVRSPVPGYAALIRPSVRRTRYFIGAVRGVLGLLLGVLAAGGAGAEEAVEAPLAARSLLLDGAAAGSLSLIHI